MNATKRRANAIARCVQRHRRALERHRTGCVNAIARRAKGIARRAKGIVQACEGHDTACDGHDTTCEGHDTTCDGDDTACDGDRKARDGVQASCDGDRATSETAGYVEATAACATPIAGLDAGTAPAASQRDTNQHAIAVSNSRHPSDDARHERPDRVAIHVMQHVPAGVHQPAERHEPVRPRRRVRDGHRDRGIDQLRDAEPAAQVREVAPSRRPALGLVDPAAERARARGTSRPRTRPRRSAATPRPSACRPRACRTVGVAAYISQWPERQPSQETRHAGWSPCWRSTASCSATSRCRASGVRARAALPAAAMQPAYHVQRVQRARRHRARRTSRLSTCHGGWRRSRARTPSSCPACTNLDAALPRADAHRALRRAVDQVARGSPSICTGAFVLAATTPAKWFPCARACAAPSTCSSTTQPSIERIAWQTSKLRLGRRAARALRRRVARAAPAAAELARRVRGASTRGMLRRHIARDRRDLSRTRTGSRARRRPVAAVPPAARAERALDHEQAPGAPCGAGAARG